MTLDETLAGPSFRAALEEAGFEPDFNVCLCGHHGSRHDLGNWCLDCPRPESKGAGFSARSAAGWDYFGSMTEDEKWAWGIGRLRAILKAERIERESMPYSSGPVIGETNEEALTRRVKYAAAHPLKGASNEG